MIWAFLRMCWALLARVPWQVWAALGIAFGVLYYGHSREKAGVEKTEAKYAAILKVRQAEVAVLEAKIRDQEKTHAHAMGNIDRHYQAELTARDDQRRRDVDAARDGSLKLRVPVSICPPAGGSAPESLGASGGGDGPATVELPREITGRLFALANDADQVADQLRACQEVIRADRLAAEGVTP